MILHAISKRRCAELRGGRPISAVSYRPPKVLRCNVVISAVTGRQLTKFVRANERRTKMFGFISNLSGTTYSALSRGVRRIIYRNLDLWREVIHCLASFCRPSLLTLRDGTMASYRTGSEIELCSRPVMDTEATVRTSTGSLAPDNRKWRRECLNAHAPPPPPTCGQVTLLTYCGDIVTRGDSGGGGVVGNSTAAAAELKAFNN